MKIGDLVEFKCIGAGKVDQPPYSKDGQWRIGLIVQQNTDNKLFSGKIKFSYVLYKGRIFRTFSNNCRALGGL